jgi:23S rRNA pseudouridine2605 synthase
MPPRPPRTEPAGRRGASRKSRDRIAPKRGGRTSAEPARVQKLLSAAGIGSRREVERWIREGRLRINGELPVLGARLGERDRVTLDGRPVRLHAASGEGHVLLYHRAPGTPLDLQEATSRAAEQLGVPRANSRWLAIQRLPPVDGGLELLTDDGSLAHKISRGLHALTTDYVLRIRGALNEPLVEEFRAAVECEGEAITIIAAEAQHGAGQNHWLNVTTRATRAAQVRHWWGARGFIVSRLMRVRLGPVHLPRDLPRGRSRALPPSERRALLQEIETAVGAAGLGTAVDAAGPGAA